MRPFLSFPVRSERRFALIGPVISQSAAVALSVPEMLVMLHDTLQVSGASTASDTAAILPFGGQSVACDGLTLEFASGNEYEANVAGGFGTPRVTPACRRRCNSLLLSSHNNSRSWIIAFIAEMTRVS